MTEYEGEEYDVLLRYVAEQDEKLKNKKKSGDDDEENEDEGKAKYKRVWYMPWKKVKQDHKATKVSTN
jgi:H+-transporting ATPase